MHDGPSEPSLTRGDLRFGCEGNAPCTQGALLSFVRHEYWVTGRNVELSGANRPQSRSLSASTTKAKAGRDCRRLG